ncbi:DNA damage-regulated autophagy modulator protein 2 [Caerostris extrusa]|uniref:DNA damage-regulated autophagy modulator protein 2 n=1 Tax=Caerostris extrusa TaxID=172846 RepID=A0AAV4UHT6_CAEEX|nr:DNA damage-regulated autophagy modulator protein 2 [Caerostris extrusa]
MFLMISLWGNIVIANSPVGYTDVPNMYIWVTSVLTEHFIAAILFIIFVLLLSALYSFYVVILEELGPDPTNLEPMKFKLYDLSKVYSPNHVLTSFSEYVFCVLPILALLNHFKDFQRVSFRLVLRHKSCIAESSEPMTII